MLEVRTAAKKLHHACTFVAFSVECSKGSPFATYGVTTLKSRAALFGSTEGSCEAETGAAHHG